VPHRACPFVRGFRRPGPSSQASGLRCHLRAQLHRRGRQDHQARQRGWSEFQGHRREVHRRILRGHGRPRRSARRHRAQMHRAHSRDAQTHERAHREGPRLRHAVRRRVFQGPQFPGLRQAVRSQHRGPGGRCPRGAR